MTHRAAAGFFAVAGFAALALAGDDAKTYDIDMHERWKAGQVVTETVHETSDLDTSMGGQTLQSEHEVLDTTYVLRCDAADAEGKPTKRTVFVKSWKKTSGAVEDESISGALVTVEGKTWKLADGRSPKSLATKWLDHKFGKSGGEDPIAKLAPTKLTVGRPFTPDANAAAEAFAKAMDDAPFDPAGVKMEMTLVSAEGTPPNASGKCEIKLHAPISTLPGLPQGATVGEGSGAEAKGWRTGPLTTSAMLGEMQMEMDVTMIVILPKQAGGKTATTKGRMTESSTTVAGGEIPATPAAPKPPEAPKPPVPGSGGK